MFCVQVLVSIASVLDPKLAPEGKHVIHAYTPGNEPLDIWDGLDRNSDEYKKLKEERSRVLWRAVEKAIPDVRKRVEMEGGSCEEHVYGTMPPCMISSVSVNLGVARDFSGMKIIAEGAPQPPRKRKSQRGQRTLA